MFIEKRSGILSDCDNCQGLISKNNKMTQLKTKTELVKISIGSFPLGENGNKIFRVCPECLVKLQETLTLEPEKISEYNDLLSELIRARDNLKRLAIKNHNKKSQIKDAEKDSSRYSKLKKFDLANNNDSFVASSRKEVKYNAKIITANIEFIRTIKAKMNKAYENNKKAKFKD